MSLTVKSYSKASDLSGVKYGELNHLDCFEYAGNTFVKVYNSDTKQYQDLCISSEIDLLRALQDDKIVEPVEVEATFKELK